MITLKTLPQATAQQVYDQIKAHLLTQNSKSQGGNKCLYRDPNGLKCAAGCLIGDDEYDSKFDDLKGIDTAWESLVCRGLVPNAHVDLIRNLQIVHDTTPVEYWEGELKKSAFKFNLVS